MVDNLSFSCHSIAEKGSKSGTSVFSYLLRRSIRWWWRVWARRWLVIVWWQCLYIARWNLMMMWTHPSARWYLLLHMLRRLRLGLILMVLVILVILMIWNLRLSLWLWSIFLLSQRLRWWLRLGFCALRNWDEIIALLIWYFLLKFISFLYRTFYGEIVMTLPFTTRRESLHRSSTWN